MVSQAKYGCCTKSNLSTRPLWDSCAAGPPLLSADWSSFSQSEDILFLCFSHSRGVTHSHLQAVPARCGERESHAIAASALTRAGTSRAIWDCRKITGVASRRLGWIANGEGLPTLP